MTRVFPAAAAAPMKRMMRKIRNLFTYKLPKIKVQ